MNLSIIIIIITTVISITAFSNENAFNKLKFNPYLILHRKEWSRLFTYSLIHADWGHLFINMFVLYSFGSIVESFFSAFFPQNAHIYYILLYVGGVAFSVLYSFVKHKHNHYYNAVGASGAVSAVLFSSIVMYPTGTIMLLFFPVPIPAFVFGILYLVFSAYMAKRASDNVGHDAHFLGALFGIVFTIILRPKFILDFFDIIFF